MGKSKPQIWAVGGGKGGVGKSFLSTLLATCLANNDKRTILVDVDLGGANLHTLLGMKNPTKTVNDFIQRKYPSLAEICIDTEMDNLRVLCGASEILSLANLQFAQKRKIIRSILHLDADYIVMDLGAGTSYNVLDFFLVAHRKIVVMTPHPASIQNAYAFVRNAVFRKLSRLTSQKPSILAVIKSAMDPQNEHNVKTVKELFQFMENDGRKEDISLLRREIKEIEPVLITNKVRDRQDVDAARIIQLVAEKYLTIHSTSLGGIPLDQQVNAMMLRMVPLTHIDDANKALKAVNDIATKLL